MPKENNQREILARLTKAKQLLDDVIEEIEGGVPSPKTAISRTPHEPERSVEALDFEMPLRAFVKRYSKDLSGPKKFVLLVAYLSKGDASVRVPRSEVESNWNKLTGIMGVFNPAHTSRARENDWVTTEKTGSYYLRPRWMDALK